jgi:hypothetical protein
MRPSAEGLLAVRTGQQVVAVDQQPPQHLAGRSRGSSSSNETDRGAFVIARVGSPAAAGGTVGASRVARDAIQHSFVHAMHAGIVVAAAAMLCASVVSYSLVRSHVTHTNTG